ncbi:MAG: preprotein translocase subunit SecE [Anaerolineaceae bacterium]|jgi:preprotein translocase subunit SecE
MAEKIVKVKKEKGLARWWRETIGELHKVAWPTPKEALQLTKIVLLVMLAMGIVLGGLDFVFTKLIGLILG